MSREHPTPQELGVSFTDDEDRIARGAINRYGEAGHPRAEDKLGVRARDFVAEYVRNCLHTALADQSEPMTEKGKVNAQAALAKLNAVVTEPAQIIPQRENR